MGLYRKKVPGSFNPADIIAINETITSIQNQLISTQNIIVSLTNQINITSDQVTALENKVSPTTIKTVAAADDSIILNSAGIPYKITKADLLAGLSSGGGDTLPGGGGTTTGDIYFNSVKLLLRGVGANNNTDIIDSSNSNRVPFKIGNPIISTLKSKFDSSSIYFDGSSAIDCNFLNADFGNSVTIDFWFNSVDIAEPNTGRVLFEMRPNGGNGNYPMVHIGYSGKIRLYQNQSDILESLPILSSNTWHYGGLKLLNSDPNGTDPSKGKTELWCNGSLVGAYASENWATPHRILIGKLAYNAPSTYFLGYMSPFRVTNANRDLSIVPTASFQSS